MTGTYTGALTSSTGLAAATESSDSEARRLGMEFGSQPESARKKIIAIINSARVRDAKLRHESAPAPLTLEGPSPFPKKMLKSLSRRQRPALAWDTPSVILLGFSS